MVPVYSNTESSIAELWFEHGKAKIAQNELREAKRSFDVAVSQDPYVARVVGDCYNELGESTQDPARAREFHSTAKAYYKRLLHTPPPAPYDPAIFWADVNCRIGNQYNKLSSMNRYAYNARETQRAIAYFTDAINTLGDLKMEAAYQGRFLARVKQLAGNSIRPWYRPGAKFDPVLLNLVLQDLVALGHLRADGYDLMERFQTAASLFTYPMNEANEALVKGEIIPQMAAYLGQPAPNDTHAQVQNVVLQAFAELVKHQGWAAPQVASVLRTFVTNGNVRYEQLKNLEQCYRSLSQGNRDYAGTATPDLDLLRRQFAGSPRALEGVLALCHVYMELFDHVPDPTGPEQAMLTTLRIGEQSDDEGVVRSAIANLLYVVDTYPELSETSIDALVDLVQAHDKPERPHRNLVRESIKLYLIQMLRRKELRPYVQRALFERLDVQAEDVAQLMSTPAEPATPPIAVPQTASHLHGPVQPLIMI